MKSVLHTLGDVWTIDLPIRLVYEEGAREVREAVAAALQGGARRIVLNLEKVAFVDSRAVGELMELRSLVAAQGGRLEFLKPSRGVRNVFVVFGLNEFCDD